MKWHIIEPSEETIRILSGLVRLCWLKCIEYKYDTSNENKPEHVVIAEPMPDFWKSAPKDAQTWFNEVTKDCIATTDVTIKNEKI